MDQPSRSSADFVERDQDSESQLKSLIRLLAELKLINWEEEEEIKETTVPDRGMFLEVGTIVETGAIEVESVEIPGVDATPADAEVEDPGIVEISFPEEDPNPVFQKPVSADASSDWLTEILASEAPDSFELTEEQRESIDRLEALLEQFSRANTPAPSLPPATHLVPVVPAEHSSTTISFQVNQDRGTLDAMNLLQSLLIPDLAALQALINRLNEQISSLEHKIYDPAEHINLLMPLIAELLTRKVIESKEEIVIALTPIIDRVIVERSEQDRVAMTEAIAPVISSAITRRIKDSPEEIANAIAPMMGKAIQEQIRLEQDVMIDALYPIIGSTIAKYMAEAIRSINEKVEQAFSVKGLQRKVQAKLQGVSEAELILQEALPFSIQAIFLIQKHSGLVMAEVQAMDEALESEMLAGMLTAIRGFIRDCIARGESVADLDQIDYGDSRILLEVAGYCYLAVIVKGEPSKHLSQKMQHTLTFLIQRYGKPIEQFEGDPEMIPQAVHEALQKLMVTFDPKPSKSASVKGLLIGGLLVTSLIGIPLGWIQHRASVAHRAESLALEQLLATPELGVYRLDVKAKHKTLTLAGQLPNLYLRSRAEQVVQTALPQWWVDNRITAVDLPADPVRVSAEVKRLTAVLNTSEGIAITTRYAEGGVWVTGAVSQAEDTEKITQAFAKIPGVRSVNNTILLNAFDLRVRLYFNLGSAEILPKDFGDKIPTVIAFLKRFPNRNLQIIGHSNVAGVYGEGEPLALARAEAVRDSLIHQGIAPERLQVRTAAATVLAWDSNQPLWLGRYVEFQPDRPSSSVQK